MLPSIFSWRNRGVTQKFGLIFVLLIVLVLLIGITSYTSFLYINKMGENISRSNRIVQLVLDMDRGMERARRLHSDFFIQYPRIGLQKAHELYAQPSAREIARVIGLSNSLKNVLYGGNTSSFNEVERTEVNLFLASAKRFADTSIEAVELITRRSAPDRGIESRLHLTAEKTRALLENQPMLVATFLEARSFYYNYLIHRKRHHMQTSLNLIHKIKTTVEKDMSLPVKLRESVPENIRAMEELITELLEIDLAITAKLNDFRLQAQAIAPISKYLANQTRGRSLLAEQQIKKAYLITNYIILASIALAILAVLYIARLVHTNFTKNVLALTETAAAFSDGHLDVRVARKSDDELGQLASNFNTMADRLRDLIENLEEKVAFRTKELHQSELRFQKLVNELPQIAVQGLNEKLEIVYWNRASSVLFGYTEFEALGSSLEKLVFPELQQAEVRQSLHNWIKEGVEHAAAESVLVDKEGFEKYVYSSYALQTDSQGNKTIYCVHIDLTELRLAEVKSQISELFYRQLFDHSSSGVAVLEAVNDGEDFIFKDFNKAAEQIEKISRNEVIGRSVVDVFPGIVDIGLTDVLKEVWQTGLPKDLPETLYRDGRIEGWRESKIYKLPTGEIVTVYNDITSRKEAEEEREGMEFRLQRAQKMEAIGLMAGGIAHDLNNILSAIIGYPELLLMQLSQESGLRKPIEAIKEAGERAATVVADLLTVARGVASARSMADINTLVKEYLDSPEFFQLINLYPYIRFEKNLQGDLPLIECSPVHVKKCLMNLTSNGAEAIETTGAIVIKTCFFSASPQWQEKQGLNDKDFVVLSVSDTGTGIQPKDLEHIFEPFYTKKVMGKRSGTGLGLSVVWNTMKEHGGIVLVSSSDAGSSFDLYFPAFEGQAGIPEEEQPECVVHGRGERILVIDDEPQQCDLAKSMLEHFGYAANSVASGEEAINYLENNDVDLILLDMLMDPGINGRETYREIRKIKPEQKAVIASGFSESEDVKATLKMGAGTFIRKPYSMAELGRAVQHELGK